MGVTYDYVSTLLPSELGIDGNASNLKEVLKIYSIVGDIGSTKTEEYGDLLDILGAEGITLDYIGNMFAVNRLDLESDDDYRNRIIGTNIERKTPVSIPEMQQAINSVVLDGALTILENHQNKAANIYLTGTSSEEDIRRALSVISVFLPAGVRLIVPVVSFSTWNNIKTQFTSWQSLTDEEYIW